MDLAPPEYGEHSRLRLLLDRLSQIPDGREAHKIAYPLSELLLLAVCGTIANCDDYDDIADWGEAHLEFLRRFSPFIHGVPCGRWLGMMMNRVPPGLFSEVFSDWVRACWPQPPQWVAIDGKTLRRSHDRAAGQPALHLVSAFATQASLVLGQEAVADKSNELCAIPVLLERLAAGDGLKGALVTIDALACNATIAQAIRDAGADYLLAVKANQPTLRGEIEALFKTAPAETLETAADQIDKGHGRIERRSITLARQVDWLDGARRFPGELRLPHVAAVVRVESRVELRERCRYDTRYYVTSAKASADTIARTVRAHWGIENQLHWTLDVTFDEDRSRLRKGHGARNMAVIRHFAINLVRSAPEELKPQRSGLRRPRKNRPPAETPKTPISRRRKIAAWNPNFLFAILALPAR
jgi:predicted transposase YbfD/YdcC